MEEFKNTILENNNKDELNRYKLITNILMAIALVVFVSMTVIVSVCLIDAVKQDGWAWLGFVLILAVGTVGYVACFVLSLIALIWSVIKRNIGVKKGRITLFVVLTVLPIIAECAFIALALIL